MGYEPRFVLQDFDGRHWRGAHAAARVDLIPLFRALITHRDSDAFLGDLPPEHALIDRTSDDVGAVRLPGRKGPCEVVVKRIAASRGPLLGFGHSRAHRAHLGAHRARAHGIAAPRPLGYLECRRNPTRWVSFAVSERLDAVPLPGWCDRELWPLAETSPATFLRRKRRVVVDLAQLVARLHAARLFHGDLHAGNILVDPGRLIVIDLESLRSRGLARIRRRNMGRLLRDFSGTSRITRTDRFRFLSAYFRNHAARGVQIRRMVRELELDRARRARMASSSVRRRVAPLG